MDEPVDLLTWMVEGIDYIFTTYLFLSNVVSASLLLGLGDWIVQILEWQMTGRWKNGRSYDHIRSRHVLVVGLVIGVFNHLWYSTLHKYIDGSSLKEVFQKIALDQTIAGPFFSSAFLTGMGIMERRSPRHIFDEWKSKFWEIYKADWMFWPAAQFINFYLVDARFQVLYVNVATLVWNTFLSYARHKDLRRSFRSSIRSSITRHERRRRSS